MYSVSLLLFALYHLLPLLELIHPQSPPLQSPTHCHYLGTSHLGGSPHHQRHQSLACRLLAQWLNVKRLSCRFVLLGYISVYWLIFGSECIIIFNGVYIIVYNSALFYVYLTYLILLFAIVFFYSLSPRIIQRAVSIHLCNKLIIVKLIYLIVTVCKEGWCWIFASVLVHCERQ